MKRYYLAYGSNLNLRQMERRCPNAVPVGKAMIQDYHLLFKGSRTGNYLTIEPKEGSEVPVGVFAVTEDDENALDRYEGYPLLYYKKEIEITYTGLKSHRKRTVTAFVYIMHEDRRCGIPDDYYLTICAQGYSNFHFNMDYLNQALLDSVEKHDEVRSWN